VLLFCKFLLILFSLFVYIFRFTTIPNFFNSKLVEFEETGIRGENIDQMKAVEQFTVVMLTYNRVDIMLRAIARFDKTPFLNKVVVIWNSPDRPPPSLSRRIPHIGAPVHVGLA